MKPTWKLFLLLIIAFSTIVEAKEPPLLVPKRRSRKVVRREISDRFLLDFLVLTPLGKEDFYERRFSTFGCGVLFSIPITKMADNIGLYGSLGLAVTVSRLSLNEGDSVFTSMYFQFPILAKAVFQISRELSGDLFLGAALRTTRYDSRNTSDGGLQKISGTDFIQPEAGAGLSYKINPSFRAKLNLSYLFIGVGVGVDI